MRLERAQRAGTLAGGADARLLAGNLSIHRGVPLDSLWGEEALELQ